MKNCNIYVVTHKKFNLKNYLIDNGYILISVGDACEINNQGVSDNFNENISFKNKNYCELTALYWIWKNDDFSTYKGICHYRRYFSNSFFSHNLKKYMISSDFIKIFEKGYDIILPEKQYFIRTAEENYLKCGFKKDLDITKKVIAEKYPDYLNEYNKVMNENKSYLTNMFIAKKDVFDEYCKWLFDILFEVESRVDISTYSKQEARIFGYISERLLTVWIYHNDYKYIEKHTINSEDDMTIKYLLEQLAIKLKVYQFLKTLIWKIKKFIG